MALSWGMFFLAFIALISTVCCQRGPKAELDIIVPNIDKVVNAIDKRNFYNIMKPIRRTYSPYARVIELEESNPDEILGIFCDTIFQKNVNALVHLSVTKKAEKSKDYVLGLASSLGLPVLSFDPDYVGALEVKTYYSLILSCKKKSIAIIFITNKRDMLDWLIAS